MWPWRGHGTDRFWLAILLVTAGDRLLAGGAAVSGSSEPLASTDHARVRQLHADRGSTRPSSPVAAEVGAHVGANQAPGRSLLPLVAALVGLAGLACGARSGAGPARRRRASSHLLHPPPHDRPEGTSAPVRLTELSLRPPPKGPAVSWRFPTCNNFVGAPSWW